MSISESIADRVRRLREAANLTQAELADESGISRPSVNEIETGITAKPRRGTLAKIASTLKVSVDYLQTGGKIPLEVPTRQAPVVPMQVVAETEMEKQLKRENEELRNHVKLLTDILRTGGDLSKLASFLTDNQEAAGHTVVMRVHRDEAQAA